MIESLLSVVGQRGVDALAFLLAFALTALMDSVFHDKLPHDHGREFAVNGALSKGKARGSGLIFVLCIALVSLAFLPFKVFRARQPRLPYENQLQLGICHLRSYL